MIVTSRDSFIEGREQVGVQLPQVRILPLKDNEVANCVGSKDSTGTHNARYTTPASGDWAQANPPGKDSERSPHAHSLSSRGQSLALQFLSLKDIVLNAIFAASVCHRVERP
jgi:hypothetical protein